VSPTPTSKTRRAFISSLVKRFSGFIGIFFLVVRLLWWCRSSRGFGQRSYSALGIGSELAIVASYWAYSSSVISRISSSIWISGFVMVS
jgi:hypothetical protein